MGAEAPGRWPCHGTLLHLVLLHLNRYCLPQAAEPGAPNALVPDWFREALAYINDHLDRPLELGSLAKRAAVSPAHFSRVFKQRLGMNATDYISTKRIFAAKDGLLHPTTKSSKLPSPAALRACPIFTARLKNIRT
ncbi:AraC family transcriptional regulator [Paenibacillus sp. FSL L8-0340]|uniref:AraC family transcriptional regulator n=1 Tax=Paenibacillus sp. FSL L8-0340 TaxID=2954685 RepID=UPI0031597792